MPIDPKKLSAMAGAARRPSAPSQLVAAKKRKAAPPPPEEEEDEDEEDGDDEDAADNFSDGEDEETGPEDESSHSGIPEGEESDSDEQSEGNYPPPAGSKNPGAAIPALEQYAQEIEASCDELDYGVLTDPDLEMTDDDIAILQEGVLMLPPRLLKVIENLSGIDIDGAQTIAAHLESEGMIDDADRVAGWIFRVGQLLEQSGEEGEGSSEEPEEEYADEEAEEGYVGA